MIKEARVAQSNLSGLTYPALLTVGDDVRRLDLPPHYIDADGGAGTDEAILEGDTKENSTDCPGFLI